MCTNLHLLWTSLLSATLLMSCGDKKETTDDSNDGESVSATGTVGAIKEMANQARNIQKNGTGETVDFRTLKELLPEDADGIPRKEATGEKDGAAGFMVSTAKGKYASDDNSETIELTIVDGGGSMAMVGLAAWSMIEVDKETKDGYEKTGKMGDNKSYEKYDNSTKEGQVAVVVNKRFLITAEGHGVSMNKLKELVENVKLDKLPALKK